MAIVPSPACGPNEIIVATQVSALSPGTERAAIETGRKSLFGKAKDKPHQVKRVLEKIRSEGLFSVARQVLEKLDEPVPLGYSSAGTVLVAGSRVQDLKPGDRVASNGPHAEIVCVPRNLCARIPDNVAFDHASYGILAAIALQGVRNARPNLGETALVVGLGLVGQITVSLLRASGIRVLGTDLDSWKCDLAVKMGADQAAPSLDAKRVVELTRGLGADVVLITASTKSNGPIELAGEAVRQKGRVVIVGDISINVPRRAYYFKEAEIVVSCSYGPGRYDPSYEERGHDYPASHVRWTEQRNLQAVLDLMSAGRLDLTPLTTHRFPIDRALEAYGLIEKPDARYLGVLIEYPDKPELPARIELKAAQPNSALAAGVLGAGNFARMTLVPALRKAGLRLRAIASGSGVTAAHTGEKHGFEVVCSGEDEVINDSEVQVLFVLTRHDQHAKQVVKAIKAGHHVFVEKPLAMNSDQLDEIELALAERGTRAPVLSVGFNRRFAPSTQIIKRHFAETSAPLTISIRFNAGAIDPGHWTQDDVSGGGRIIGEACHAIDLATAIAGSPPIRVYSESIGGPNAPKVTDDQCFITLRHANGSVSSIAYLAGGDKSYPKERVEVMGGGRLAVIEDWREVTTVANGKTSVSKAWSQDKGYAGELDAFLTSIVQGGPAPIAWPELRSTTLASIFAVMSLREGLPFDLP